MAVGGTVVMVMPLVWLLSKRPSGILGSQTTLSESEIIAVANLAREKEGIPPLHPQPQLMTAAAAKAKAMIDSNSWSHNIPSATPWQFIDASGYVYTIAGENLAKDFTSATDVVDGWLNSPSHRNNLLNREYTETGVAVVEADYQGKNHTTLVVQYLAKAYDPASNESFEPNQLIQAPIITRQIRKLNPLTVIITFMLGCLTVAGLIIYRVIRKTKPHRQKIPAISHWHH